MVHRFKGVVVTLVVFKQGNHGKWHGCFTWFRRFGTMGGKACKLSLPKVPKLLWVLCS